MLQMMSNARTNAAKIVANVVGAHYEQYTKIQSFDLPK